MNNANAKYSVNLSFQSIKLPPVTDILILARKLEQGKIGVMQSFRFLAPDEFDMFDIDDADIDVEAILINKKILKKMPKENIINVLKKHVFPFISKGEAIKVDFNVVMTCDSIKGNFN